MDKAMRDVVHIPEGEVLKIWSVPGWHDCPLATAERGVTNCPLAFDSRGVPAEPQPWMKGACEDGSWRERWCQILGFCRQCQGKPGPSEDEKGRLREIQRALFKMR